MKVGDHLSNGSMVLVWKEERDSQVVLALNQKNEFVVWGIDHNGSAYGGLYCQDLLTAVDTYKIRA